MSELNVLKDLVIEINAGLDYDMPVLEICSIPAKEFRETLNSSFVRTKDLRDLGITWIKEVRFRSRYQEHVVNEENALIHTEHWIKCFFGITEQDIRGELK